MVDVTETFVNFPYRLSTVNDNGIENLPQRGYYVWWGSELALVQLQIPLPCTHLFYLSYHDIPYFMLYIGIGPKNQASNQMLPERINGCHIRGNIGVSTLRKAIASLTNYLNHQITTFLSTEFLITVAANNTPWNIERDFIRNYHPPLNCQHNTQGWFYGQIKKARKSWNTPS